MDAVLFFHTGLLNVQAFTGTYGINYGRIADNIPPPESVVTLLKASKIKNVRIYDADHSVLTAFKGSGLELDISISEDRAMSWLKENVQAFLPDTHIRELQEALLGACKNIYDALDKLQLTDLIQVSTAHSEAVFANSYPPSSCTFKEEVIQYIMPLLQFFFTSRIAPSTSMLTLFWHTRAIQNILTLNMLYLSRTLEYMTQKTDLHYDNMFDAQIDAAYAALEALGFEKMEVRVSETGWASDGDKDEAGASVENARTYNYNLRKRLFKRKGTPLRPKMVVKAYVFALFNENLKPGPASERHYGLFKADGSIAYDIGFSGLSPSSASALHLSIKVNASEILIIIFYLKSF
ncbi:unnamed protein product [Spirodela intermedia]|uniref:Uncharacterized protein n=1 Tax=Spirodela intermedia TaxID=51605 RepID=A0A7I8J845_SPIIN|nr:unnamed protein product [Spirodela intermedia]CAA6666398.1 unnamed protein product [Spirodela intermedia]